VLRLVRFRDDPEKDRRARLLDEELAATCKRVGATLPEAAVGLIYAACSLCELNGATFEGLTELFALGWEAAKTHNSRREQEVKC
jgi:hypothetical protein